MKIENLIHTPYLIAKDLMALKGYASWKVMISRSGVSFRFGQIVMWVKSRGGHSELMLRVKCFLQVWEVPSRMSAVNLSELLSMKVNKHILFAYMFSAEKFSFKEQEILHGLLTEKIIQDIFVEYKTRCLHIRFAGGVILSIFPGTVKENESWEFSSFVNDRELSVMMFKRKISRRYFYYNPSVREE